MTAPDSFSSRLNTAGQAVGPTRPQLAATLAQSDLSHQEISAVGGFAHAMSLATTQKLAANSGVNVNFTGKERDALSAVKQPVEDQTDSRSFLEKAVDGVAGAIGDSMSFLIHNTVTQHVLSGFEQIGRSTKWLFRLASDAIDSSNNDEVDREMKADGYDPSSTASYLAFVWSQGENLYHNVDAIRDTYGNDLVDKVIQYQRDPEQFLKDANGLPTADRAQLQKLTQSADWAKAADLLNRNHISPGRDLAALVTAGNRDSKAFTLLSGALDAAYTWFTDPTLIAGKGIAAARAIDVVTGELAKGVSFTPSNVLARGIDTFRGGAQRSGIWSDASKLDDNGIKTLLATDRNGKPLTDVGRGWQRMLDDSQDLSAAHTRWTEATKAEDKAKAGAEMAGIYRVMQNRYGPLMGMLDEILGSRRIGDAVEESATPLDSLSTGGAAGGFGSVFPTTKTPIKDLDELREYLTSKSGLLNLHTGMAASRRMVAPGRLSMWAERTAAKDKVNAKWTGAKAQWLNYDDARKLLPEDATPSTWEALGNAQNQLLQRSALLSIAAAKAKVDRIARRISTTLPTAGKIDLNDGNSARTVEQFARIWLNKGDAAKLSAAYTFSDLAGRRQILRGVIEQTMHASGVAKSADGQQWMREFLGEIDDIGAQQYGLGGTSKIVQAGTKAEREVAILPSQLATQVPLPDLKVLQRTAAKMAVHGWARANPYTLMNSGLQSDFTDKLLAPIKLGWIATLAGGLRNGIDEIANFAAYGIGKEVWSARSAFSHATAATRDARYQASKKYLADVKATGRNVTDERYASEILDARRSHEIATRELARAQQVQDERDNFLENLNRRSEIARNELANAKDYNFRAHQELMDAQAANLPYPKYAPVRAKAEDAANQLRLAKETLKQRQKDLLDPKKVLDAREADWEKQGVLGLDDAKENLRVAELRRKDAAVLETVIRHRVPLIFRGVADNLNDLFVASALGHGMRVFGKEWGVTADSEKVEIAKELVDRELTRTLREGIFQSHFHEGALLDGGHEYASGIVKSGLLARKYAYRSAGWGEIEPDGGAGLDAWAKMLGLAFADEKSPAHAWLQTVRALHPKPREIDVIDHTVPFDPHGDVRDASAVEHARAGTDRHSAAFDEALQRWERVNGRPAETPDDFDEVENAAHVLMDHSTYRPTEADAAKLRTLRGTQAPTPPMTKATQPVTSDDWREVLEAAKQSVARRVAEDDLRQFRSQAEVFRQLNDGTPVPADAPQELLDQLHEQYAERLSAHLAYMLIKDGKINPKLMDALGESHASGVVPDASWLANNVPIAQRPEKVIGQLWAPYNPAHEPGGIAAGYTQMLAKAYGKVVTDQINALSRNPLVTALYYNARKNTYPYRDFLVGEGFHPDVADEITKRIALRHSEVEALKHIDNPYVSSQASFIYRNWGNFIRAQEDWLRRWGRTAKDNPQLIREAQLLIGGAQDAGFVEKNDQGDFTFVYPGSRLFLGALGKLFTPSGLPSGAQIPMTGELTSQLTFLNPSLDNPIGITASPILSMGIRGLTALLGPDHALLNSSLDELANGKAGAGRAFYEQFLPSWANRIISGVLSTEDPHSKYGASVAQTINNLEAAGLLDDPRMQTGPGKAALYHAIQVGTRNAMVFQTLFGLWAPAAPTMDMGATATSDTVNPATGQAAPSQGNTPDWLYHQQGIHSLKDEARKLVSDVGFEKALQIWTAIHPNELVYVTGSRTQIGTPGATAPASVAAARYIEQNQSFFDKYGGPGGVAAYFLPQGKAGTPNGEFSDVAYQAELESGLREYKSLKDYFADVITARGARDYFAAKDSYDAAKAAAQQSGRHSEVARLDAQWQAEKDLITNANPLLATRFAQYALDQSGQQNTLLALGQLVGDPDPAVSKALGANRLGVAKLLTAWNDYQSQNAALAQRGGNAANAKRASLRAEYEATVAALAGGTNSQFPELADLARGAFRLP